MREHRRAALCAKDTDIEQRQARPLHQAGLRLRRREGPLHLPSRRALDERACPIRSPRRHRPVRHLTACFTCPLKPRCTPDKLKRVKRWVHEDVLDAMQARLDRMTDAMLVRRQTVEHPYGTIKAWMGSTHFLTRTLKRVSTEMSLHVLAYNVCPAPFASRGHESG